MAERVGIFGGSFNPVHTGHLVMAQDALERFGLHKVLWIPAAQPPHKLSQALAPAADRLDMLRLALQDDPRFEVSEEELNRGGVSYTVDTVQRLQTRRPEVQWTLIIGGDTLCELHTWKDIGRLLTLCQIVTVARPGFAADKMDPTLLRLPEPWPRKLLADVITGHRVEIASSELRQRIQRGQSIRYLVPEAVERYIRERRLYSC
jgi:nicotinate-nucleotide adenylyltransferase